MYNHLRQNDKKKNERLPTWNTDMYNVAALRWFIKASLWCELFKTKLGMNLSYKTIISRYMTA